jgi:NADH-quinone oxidoreductase subunit L
LPPFAGAFSKDAVLSAAHERGGGLGDAVYVVGLVTVAVTAAYVTRMICRTFLGGYRGAGRGDAEQLHESPWVMTSPLVLLAAFSVGLGAPLLPSSYGVRRWFDAPAGARALDVGVSGVVLTSVIVLLAAGAVLAIHLRQPDADPLRVLGRAALPARRAFWVDAAYDLALVRPVRAVAGVASRVDRRGVDSMVTGTGRSAGLLGAALRRAQNGNVQAYLSALVGLVMAAVLVVSLAVVA